MAKSDGDIYSPEEQRRVEAALRAAFNTPPKPKTGAKAGKASKGKRSEVKDSHDRYANVERKAGKAASKPEASKAK